MANPTGRPAEGDQGERPRRPGSLRSGVRWTVERARGGAGTLLARGVPDAPTVRVARVDAPALVLGSTQPDSAVNWPVTRSAGVDVVRRRSGGGAVLVVPTEIVWIDVVLPAGHALWEADVSRSFGWLGATWVAALGDLGVENATVHAGGLQCTPWSRQVCFGGLGPGEVAVAGRKVVGIAQRRTRETCLFQCAVPLRWNPSPLVEMLAIAERARAAAELSTSVLPVERPAADVEAAFLASLP